MSARRNSDAALAVWGAAYVLIGVALATAFAWPIYDTVRLAVIAAVATALTAVIAAIATRLRWRAWLTALIAILVYAAAVVPLAIPGALGTPLQILRGVRDGIVGVVVGWKQLLTLSLPLGEYQAVLVPFFLVVFLGSLLGFVLAFRSGGSALPVPVIFAMSAFGMAFGSSAASSPITVAGFSLPAPREVLLTTALVLVSLLWLIGRARLARASALRAARAKTSTVRQRAESFSIAARRNALAVGLVVIALVAGLAIAPAAADIGTRKALRDGVDPVLIVRQQPSPLSGYRGWFETARYSDELFRVSGATKGIDRIRLATLDSYDGEDFHLSGARDGEAGRFSRLPRTAPASAGETALTITIGPGYSGIWVPVPDGLTAAPVFAGSRAEALSDAFYVGAGGSSAIDVAKGEGSDAAAGLRPGDSYRVYAQPTDHGVAELGTGASGKSLLDVSQYPAMAEWVKQQQLPRTANGFAEAVKRLRARGYLSHSIADASGARSWVAALKAQAPYVFQPSYSGNSQSRVESVFSTLSTQQRRAGNGATDSMLVAAVGDDEQFAAATALLARYWGFDSRVVVGVQLGSSGPSAGVPACDGVCTGSTMTAWVEVSRPGGSWVGFDATPQFQTAPTAISEGEQLPKNPTVPDQQQSSVIDPPQVDRDSSDSASAPHQELPGWLESVLPVLRVVGLSLLALLLLVLPVLVLAVAKRVRRRQRRAAAVPEVSVVGAWDELVDSYVDYGVPFSRAGTRQQVAESAARPAAMALALAVDRAVFAEHPSGRDASGASWELFDAERRELDAAGTVFQRCVARITPASFVRQLNPSSMIAAGLSVFRRKEKLQ
jgi:transglutaminase-like putative cysteine protease